MKTDIKKMSFKIEFLICLKNETIFIKKKKKLEDEGHSKICGKIGSFQYIIF